ncbi:MAG: MBOAT family protein [Eubacterium sp.]|nr:MBOAT family protein [Eubacterium sp.]MCM1214539.1 MBOAT family protein [Lachnospiraceae bacterium]MCM1238418.1 MBOAT family protein [Lachnospiraceae bacterium]
MVFSSVMFLFRFLPFFFIAYFLIPGRGKNVILFLGSLLFYAWGEPVYVLLMLFSTIVDYVNGRLIGRFRGRNQAKAFLILSVMVNLFILCFFKYADFLIRSINGLTGAGLPLLDLPLPIGISFYTFQTMSYTIDVYRGKAKVQKNILDFGVYVAMFPQLIAGPIVRYSSVEEDLHHRKVDIMGISHGLKRFVTGLAKKALLANTIGELWAEISAMDFGSLSVFTAWMGILAFAFQIYFDFSGYSDMAIGLGEILGFRFPENFDHPYIASSVTDFWRRWHISLGSWFREYVYIPLGGNRKGVPRQLLNILIVWMLTGIWHGAGWNFLLWGLWFALLLMMEKLFLGKVLARLPKGVGILYNGLAVLLGWVLFALGTPAGIGGYLAAMFGFGGKLTDSLGLYLFGEYLILFAIAAVAATPLPGMLAGRLERAETGWGIALYRLWEKVVPAVLLLLSITVIVDGTFNPFLYFRF